MARFLTFFFYIIGTHAVREPLSTRVVTSGRGYDGIITEDRDLVDTSAKTVFVLKVYGTFTPYTLSLMERYANDLKDSGVPLAVLRDASVVRRRGLALGDGEVRSSTIQLNTGTRVPLCDVSRQAAIKEWGSAVFQGLTASSVVNPAQEVGKGTHNQNEALWRLYCWPSSQLEYVWFSEGDAMFNGQLSKFVQDLSAHTEDLVSSSFRFAGRGWWNYNAFQPAIKAGLELFDYQAKNLVTNVEQLPPLSQPPCGDGSMNDPKHPGLVFRQDMVERWSVRLFDMLHGALMRGMLGPSEAFLSTLCAGSEDCTLYDWAPVEQRSSGVTWASPLWCWAGALSSKQQCQDRFHQKWIHPAKATHADAFLCESLKTNHSDLATNFSDVEKI